MADADANGDGMFKRATMNRVASPDELDHYIKVTNPSAWVVILAALLLVGGIIAWAIVAVVPVTVETTGVVVKTPESGEAIVACWVDKATADRIGETGLKASINGVEAKSAKLNETPMSASEVVKFLGSDFYAQSIDLNDWNYLVTLEPDGALESSGFSIYTEQGEAHLVPVSLITSETRPINIVLGKK